MLLERANSCLLLIDVQEKLTPLVVNSDAMVKRSKKLMEVAEVLEIPIIVSEQYPKGLSPTIEELKHKPMIEKVHFSCWREPNFKKELSKINKKQFVLMGIETHVCILQTALDLKAANYEVFVVVDAVSSREDFDHRYGLKRMKQAKIELVTTEMVFFEWLEKADTEEFRTLSKLFFPK